MVIVAIQYLMVSLKAYGLARLEGHGRLPRIRETTATIFMQREQYSIDDLYEGVLSRNEVAFYDIC